MPHVLHIYNLRLPPEGVLLIPAPGSRVSRDPCPRTTPTWGAWIQVTHIRWYISYRKYHCSQIIENCFPCCRWNEIPSYHFWLDCLTSVVFTSENYHIYMLPMLCSILNHIVDFLICITFPIFWSFYDPFHQQSWHPHIERIVCKFRADSRFASSQWETALLCNDVSHWLGASLESARSSLDALEDVTFSMTIM